MERLLAVIGDFTDHVSSMASIHLQRDTAKKHLARQEAEFVKWRKQHLSFPPLAEQQEKSRASAQKDFDDLDRKLKQHVKSRDQLAKAVAMSVLSNQNDGGVERARVQFLEDELQATSSEVQRLRAEVNQTPSEYSQIQDDFVQSQKRIADMEIKLGRLMATSAKPSVAPPVDNSTLGLEKEISKLQEKLTLIQDMVDGLPNLKLDLSKSKEEVYDLKRLVKVQVDGLQELKGAVDGQVNSLRGLEESVAELKSTTVALKGTVVGEADDKGLIDVIASVEEDVEKLRSAMKTTDEELNGFQDELHKFGGRIANVERGTSHRQTPQLSTTTTKADDTELQSGLEAIKAAVAEVQTDIATIRREQEEKDELVAADIEVLNSSTSKLDETVQTHRDELEAAIGRINSSISTLQARPSPPVALSNPPTPGSLTNGTSKLEDVIAKKFQDTLKQHRTALEYHRDNIIALERAVQHLDDRFNNLATDGLARNMVHQMSEIYPHAANVQTELDLAKKRDEQLHQNFTGLFTKVAQLEKLVSEAEAPISQEQLQALQKRLDALSDEIKTIRTHADTDCKAITNRVNAIDSTIQIQTPQFRENISSLRKEVGALSSHIDDWGNQTTTYLGNVGMQLEQLNEHCGLMFAKPQEEGSHIATTKQKLTVQQNLAANTTAADDGRSVTAGITTDGPADADAGNEDMQTPGMRRTHLLKRKKRKLVEGSDEEGDILQGRDEGRSGE